MFSNSFGVKIPRTNFNKKKFFNKALFNRVFKGFYFSSKIKIALTICFSVIFSQISVGQIITLAQTAYGTGGYNPCPFGGSACGGLSVDTTGASCTLNATVSKDSQNVACTISDIIITDDRGTAVGWSATYTVHNFYNGNNLIPICSSVSCETPNLSVNMADFVTITGRNFGATDTTSTQRPTALTSMDPNGVNSPSFSLMSFNNAGGTYAKARVSNPGTGYTSSPNVIFSGGGCTQNPTATATVNSGKLTGLVFTAPGLGCSSSPTVAFQGGGGSEASVVLIAGAGDGVYSKGTTANGFVLTIPGNSRVGVYNSVITISVS